MNLYNMLKMLLHRQMTPDDFINARRFREIAEGPAKLRYRETKDGFEISYAMRSSVASAETNYFYDEQGKLMRRREVVFRISNRIEKDEKIYEYNPHGRFVGKRVR